MTDGTHKHEVIETGKAETFCGSLLYVYANVPKDSINSTIVEA